MYEYGKTHSIFPWYDSYWLNDYVKVRRNLEENHPEKLQNFESKMQIFACPQNFKAKHLKDFTTKKLLENIRDYIENEINILDLDRNEIKNFGRFKTTNLSFFDEIHKKLLPVVEDLAGEELDCSYNFLSLYSNAGYCKPHLDAAFAKWTLDLCINQSEPWPIYFSDVTPWPLDESQWTKDWENTILQENHFTKVVMQPGDAALFTGPNQWHYREPMGNKAIQAHCDLIFFHFIPKGSRQISQPAHWAEIFEVPEINNLITCT